MPQQEYPLGELPHEPSPDPVHVEAWIPLPRISRWGAATTGVVSLGLAFFVVTARAVDANPVLVCILSTVALVFLVLVLVRHYKNGKTEETSESDSLESGDAS